MTLFDLRPLRSPTFRRLAAAYLINEFGTWIGELALAVLVFDRTGSALATAGLFLALRFLPSLVAPLATSWVETMKPHLLLPALYLLEAVLYAAIAILASHFWLPVVLLLTALDGAVAIVAKALTRSANANELLKRDLLREGNAILNMGFMIASALGPALAGALLAWKGAGIALAVDAVTFGVAALIIFTATGLHVESDHEAGAGGRLRSGLTVISENPTLKWLLVAFGVVLFLFSVAVPVEVIFAKQILHAGDRGYGFMLGSWGVGMIIGGVIYAGASRINNVTLLLAAAMLNAAGYGGLAVSDTLLAACAFSVLGGIGNGIGGITAITAIQQAIPLTAQSVVMAVFETINQAAPALGFVVGGAVAALGDARDAYAVSAIGVAIVIVGACVLIGMSRYARVRRPPPHAPGEGPMTEPSTSSDPDVRIAPWWSDRRLLYAAVADTLLLAVAVVIAIRISDQANWDLTLLAIIIALAVGSELLAVWVSESQVFVSGSFLGVMLAAVVLGGTPGAIVGVITIGVGWLRSREASYKLLHNLANYALFPLIAGLVLHALVQATGDKPPDNADYYLLVMLTFLVGLAVNLALTHAYVIFALREPWRESLAGLQPIIAPELATAVLTLICAYLVLNVGPTALILAGLVLGLFQYLVGELLKSRARAEVLRIQATTDMLTGLFNYAHFLDLLQLEIAEAAAKHQQFAVLLLNLDHFKDVNDTLGHEYGNQLLQQLAPRLAEHAGEGAVLARFAGDSFVVVPAVRTADPAELDVIANELRASVREPLTVGEVTISVNASIGIACYPQDGTDATTLLRRVDIAMHDAKQQRDTHNFYDPERDHHSALRLSLLGDFRDALESPDQIVLVYHPIVDVAGGRLGGAEALVRWHHPELGMLTPAAFMEPVEHTELIGPLTATVLDRAISDAVRWEREGLELSVSVNLSVRNLYDNSLAALVQETLDRHGLPAQRLKLEITESMFVADLPRVLTTSRELRKLGVRLAVDDFGTGHASLANLRLLPVDELKIDRSFVTPMLQESSDMVIVRSTIELGHALGLLVVAEGVEQRETFEVLGALGCDRAQGHYFSTPLPADEFLSWAGSFSAV